MSYIIELKKQCQTPGCHKSAVVEVFNRFNATMGVFCRACGNSVFKEQGKKDKQS